MPLPLALKFALMHAHRGIGNRRSSAKGLGPFVQFQMLPTLSQMLMITGVTKDAAGATLGGCTVDLMVTPSDTRFATTTSDGSGNFSFGPLNNGNGPFYIVAYKPGSPDVCGTTSNALIGT